jgi:hypothetical protein
MNTNYHVSYSGFKWFTSPEDGELKPISEYRQRQADLVRYYMSQGHSRVVARLIVEALMEVCDDEAILSF